ncbi:hypothetical protein JQ621_20830 [Bradyrhizobium manausense]|uniref:hypothetical protein n=1 Tax=Bradyrhizobium manausense TaxID=989370 RepID=UPI001BA67676|nr:hypothetical protein [Bradyrhizobium manausense]MBR1089915.1 hypothetical protein [Bradyrhizobium manausense]
MTLPAASAERIAFKHQNAADLRGLVNVLTAFRAACLAEPVTPGLPAQLVPDGYRIVTRSVHMWGREDGSFPDTAILSKTGDEDSDIAGGYPIIDLMLPTAKLPDGACSISWKRRWSQDYPDGASRLSLDMAASLPADVSYYLNATLLSKPNDFFVIADSYGDLTTWRTECRATRRCRFDVIPRIDQQGIDVTIVFRGEQEK